MCAGWITVSDIKYGLEKSYLVEGVGVIGSWTTVALRKVVAWGGCGFSYFILVCMVYQFYRN